jgi:hypothetical protein
MWIGTPHVWSVLYKTNTNLIGSWKEAFCCEVNERERERESVYVYSEVLTCFFLYFKNIYFLYFKIFLYHFNLLILKINLKKLKKYYFNLFFKNKFFKKHLQTQHRQVLIKPCHLLSCVLKTI